MMDEPDQIGGADVRPATIPSTRVTPDVEQREAFRDFYRDFTPKLVAFLIQHGARTVDAADVVQETMLLAWRNWSTIEHPKTWARTVASRKLVRRIASITEDLIAEPEQSALLGSSHQVDNWVEQHDLVRVMAALPPRQRQVMAWTLAGYKPSEIAEQLALDPATVRSNLRQARKTLATHRDRSARK
ncbi:sigma-70 family RNA polymerase sigma factor [Nocardia amikacinitolerans]|uniref:sigma-70 family RNA polymerase sigma factor n=1 Tax=Nocardia amikacinitolerans TaxID=756689 RepID=UPI0036A05997